MKGTSHGPASSVGIEQILGSDSAEGAQLRFPERGQLPGVGPGLESIEHRGRADELARRGEIEFSGIEPVQRRRELKAEGGSVETGTIGQHDPHASADLARVAVRLRRKL